MELTREGKLVSQFKDAKDNVTDLNEQLSEAKKKLSDTERDLLELMVTEGKDRTADYTGIGYITKKSPRLFASCTKGNEPALFDYLEKQKRQDLIQQSVPSGKLSTFAKELLADGEKLPECISYWFKTSLQLFPK